MKFDWTWIIVALVVVALSGQIVAFEHEGGTLRFRLCDSAQTWGQCEQAARLYGYVSFEDQYTALVTYEIDGLNRTAWYEVDNRPQHGRTR